MGARQSLPPRPADRSIGQAVAAVLAPDRASSRDVARAAKAQRIRDDILGFFRANRDEWLMFHDVPTKFGCRPEMARDVLAALGSEGLLTRERCLEKRGRVSHIYSAGPKL